MGDIFPEEKGDECGGEKVEDACGDELTAALQPRHAAVVGIGMTHFNISSSKEFL